MSDRDDDPPAGAPAARKLNVLGVLVDAVDYEAAAGNVLAASRQGRPFSLTALAVHGVMTGVGDAVHRNRLNEFDLVAPDGQPVRWAMNLLYGAGLRDWVSGPDLIDRILPTLARDGLPVYLYGSTAETLAALVTSLTRRYPGLIIAGAEPSKFRSAGRAELSEIAERIRLSGARLVLVGLGCPRQEIFVHALRPLLDMPLLAVGAAFDYHAGQLRRAPVWMQRRGLAWLFRLAVEPRRLWRRYLLLNPAYLGALAAQKLRVWTPATPRGGNRPELPGTVPV